MSSASLADQACSTGASKPPSVISESTPVSSATSSRTKKRRKSSAPASATATCETRPSGLMSSLSPEQGLEAMLAELSQASPVSPSPSLAKSLARATSAICSEMSSESLMTLDASCSFWKTRQACLFPIPTDPTNQHPLQTYLGSWPKAALIVRGSLYPLKMWERRTVENAGGASRGANWFTPHGQANKDHTGKVGGGGELDMQVRNWPTPTREEDMTVRCQSTDPLFSHGGMHAASLSRVVPRWAAPQAHDVHAGCAERVGRFGTAHGGRNLTDDVQKWSTPRAEGERDLTEQPSCSAVKANGRYERESGGGDFNPPLSTQVKQWPTAKSSDANGSGKHGRGGADLRTTVEKWNKKLEHPRG